MRGISCVCLNTSLGLGISDYSTSYSKLFSVLGMANSSILGASSSSLFSSRVAGVYPVSDYLGVNSSSYARDAP